MIRAEASSAKLLVHSNVWAITIKLCSLRVRVLYCVRDGCACARIYVYIVSAMVDSAFAPRGERSCGCRIWVALGGERTPKFESVQTGRQYFP